MHVKQQTEEEKNSLESGPCLCPNPCIFLGVTLSFSLSLSLSLCPHPLESRVCLCLWYMEVVQLVTWREIDHVM